MTPNIETLAAIHAEAFDAPWDAAALRALVERPGAVLQAEADGFALLQVAGDEAEVLTLAVRPAARRGGVGVRLIRAVADRAAGLGVRRIFLEVAEDNVAARGLYATLGFQPAGRRPRYYPRPNGARIDALLLVLILPRPLP